MKFELGLINQLHDRVTYSGVASCNNCGIDSGFQAMCKRLQ